MRFRTAQKEMKREKDAVSNSNIQIGFSGFFIRMFLGGTRGRISVQ